MKYSYIIGEGSATLINLGTGSNVTLMKNDKGFDRFLRLLKSGDFVEAELAADVVAKISSFVGTATMGPITIAIKDSSVTYTFNGQGPFPLHNAIVERIVAMADDGFDVKPLVAFLANLLNNPDKTSIDELYLFLEASNLPITEDGCFIAYKIVKNDYMDIYSGTTRNQIGDVRSMPRFEVDTNRHNTCSRGLHFCSKSYLPHYGTGRAGGDRCMLVKINPADVVSIPSDYNNAKGRAWKYEVVGEMNATEWRTLLAASDFTASSVVSPTAVPKVTRSVAESMDAVFYEHFYVDEGDVWWVDTDRLAEHRYIVSKLMKFCDVSEDEADEFVFTKLREEDDLPDPFSADFFDDVDVDVTVGDLSRAIGFESTWGTVRNYGFDFDFDKEVWVDSFGSPTPIDVSVRRVSEVTGLPVNELNDLTE